MNITNKRAYYAFGGITGFFVLAGGAFLLMTLLASMRLGSRMSDIGGPYATIFFSVYSGLNVIFLTMLAFSALRLCRVDRRGVGLLALTLKLELLYFIASSGLWFLPASFGKGAAAAFGVGNMGISPQIYIAYPVTGLLALWLLRRRGVLNGEQGASPNGGPAEPSASSGVGGGPPSVS
jgi:hypothetical protein